MDFPAYVPAGARKHIRYTLEGNGNAGGFPGVNAFVQEHSQRADSGDALEELKREQACVTRFAHDARMQDVYIALNETFTQDDQYRVFLTAAFNAHQDYTPWRERAKKHKELTPKIAKAARELADLLNEAGAIGAGTAPSEFFSVRALLDETEGTGHNRNFWPSVRGTITGARRWPAMAEHERPQPDALPSVVEIVCIEPSAQLMRDPIEESRNMLAYAWEKAPDLPAMLETVACAAEQWRLDVGDVPNAAIASRKQSPKTEYLRAFAEILRNELRLSTLPALVITAMAGIANVVLNDPNLDVSRDDVRKAAIGPPVEDSI